MNKCNDYNGLGPSGGLRQAGAEGRDFLPVNGAEFGRYRGPAGVKDLFDVG